MSVSRRHQLLARAIPQLRRFRELDSAAVKRARPEHRTSGRSPRLSAWLVPRFGRRFSLVTEVLSGPGGDFPSYVITPRGSATGREPRRTIVYLHGGGYVAGIDPFHVRYVTRLAEALDARIVMPDYPLAPEHTWRDSHPAIADLAARWTADSDELVLMGDSAGGGYALAIALALRDRGGPQPARLVLHSPWVDLTTSTPETPAYAARDPWLSLDRLRAYADWWAGSAEDLGRPELSPALGDLVGLPPGLMFCGTRDTLAPGCRLLAKRAADAGWDLTYVEEPDLIHVYPLLLFVPEAKAAWTQTIGFLR